MSNQIYTVKNFCKKYNEANIEQTKEAYVKSVMNPCYVPYEKKISLCEKIIQASYYKKDMHGNKKLHIDSPVQYMLYCLTMLNEYTNISVDFSNVIEEFNLLNKNNLFEAIFYLIPEKETKEFNVVLDMVRNDTLQNEYETHAFISGQVERFGELIGVSLKPVLEELTRTLENMDEKTVDKIGEKIKSLNMLKGKFNILNK